jgi:predicted secreted protein
MSLAFAAAIYFVIWWIVLFAMLPIGVRTSEEVGEETAPGNADSAPHMPMLLPKMVATTVVASIVFAGVYAIVVHHVITLDDIPLFPRYERMQSPQ